MPKVKFSPEEDILVDLNPTRRALFFPILNMIIVTGITFFLIGACDSFFDSHALEQAGVVLANPLDSPILYPSTMTTIVLWLRRLMVILWVLLLWRYGIRHIISRQRSRFILTNRRMIIATGHWRSHITQIALKDIAAIRRKRNTITIYWHSPYNPRGYAAPYPVTVKNIPYAKKIHAQMEYMSSAVS